LDVDLGECLFDLLEFKRLNDSFDFFHDLIAGLSNDSNCRARF
jgi:hypothetical protein